MNEILTNADTKNKQKTNIKPVYGLKTLIKSLKLIDIWREVNKTKMQFTWKRKNNINEATRIDYFLISPELRTQVESTDIRPAIITHTDHQAISLKIKGRSHDRGKGYFKINNSILANEDYKKLIKSIITKYKENLILTTDIDAQWDLFKAEVRDLTQMFCKRKAKQTKNDITLLENELSELHQKQNNSTDNNITLDDKIQDIESKLESLYSKKIKGAQVRSRIKWIEEGEKTLNSFWAWKKVDKQGK